MCIMKYSIPCAAMTFCRTTKMRNLKWQYLLESITIVSLMLSVVMQIVVEPLMLLSRLFFQIFCIKVSNKFLNEVGNISNICHYCPLVE
jgi:hypothetical protein